jgi:hypothetical protein
MIFTQCPYCDYPVCFEYNADYPRSRVILICGEGVDDVKDKNGNPVEPCGKEFWGTNTNLPDGKTYPLEAFPDPRT